MKQLTLLFFCSTFFISLLNAQEDFDYEPADYGIGKSIGISLLGDGTVGMTFKFAQPNQNQWEITPAYASRQEIFNINDEIEFGDFYHGVSLTGGYNILMGSNYKRKKHKVIKNYIGLRAAAMYRGEEEIGLSFVWHREAFRPSEQSYSRGLDLGLTYRTIVGDGSYLDSDGNLTDSYVGLYLRFDWNWFR